jgi:hypothetical protein
MKLKKIEDNILQATDTVQMLVDLEFQKVGDKLPPGSALDQEGLRNGRDIVKEYIDHGEAGLALEHLVYMFHETGVNISEATRKLIVDAAIAMGMDTIQL